MNRLFCEHTKRNVIDLNGPWLFLKDPDRVGLEQGYHLGLPDGETVTVPSCWNTQLGMLNYEGLCWYEKKLTTSGGTLYLEFESVMTEATVWLDGTLLGKHYGAFSQFDFIVNDVSEGEHTLVVLADSSFTKESIPQRKVDWFNYGGIARPVYAHELKGISVLLNHVKYELNEGLNKATISCDIELYNATPIERTESVKITLDDTLIYNGWATLGGYERVKITTPAYEFEGVELWDIDSPRLYTATATTDSDDLVDRVGFRKIEAKNSKIYLNNKEIELRGVNRHEEHPDWGFAFPEGLMKKDIDLILNMGCNTIRGAHYPQSRIFIDMLDERGILFWSEIPIWGGGFPDDVLENPVVVERGLEMHREMTKYYYNHPSIIIWGMHNEIYTLYPCTHGISEKYHGHLRAHGGNRLITHAAAFPFEDDSLEFDDIICINMYHGWYGGDLKAWDKTVDDFRAHREKLGMSHKPVVFSEFGAGALAGYHQHFDNLRWSEEYQSDLLKYCLELFHRTDCICGFYIWQFMNIRTSDEMNINRVRYYNNKGIVDEYRNPKKAYFTVKELYEGFSEE
ncbi:MAG: beta-glucuronidase [Clostridia bacterium]|nr:beta-glucuronidase [Clostridia bacterium]